MIVPRYYEDLEMLHDNTILLKIGKVPIGFNC